MRSPALTNRLDFQDLREQFGVEVQSRAFLPVPLRPLAPPGWLREFLVCHPETEAILGALSWIVSQFQ